VSFVELKHIIFFNTVCKFKSFSKAANELFITQQAVSKKIKELEEELNTLLFIRSSFGVELTEEGYYFLEQSAMILKKSDEIIQYYTKISNSKRNSLKIGIAYGIKVLLRKAIFQEFEKNNQEIELEIGEMLNQDVENGIVDKSLDIGITINPDNIPNIRSISLFHEPICCIVNKHHPLASKVSLTFDEILNETIVMADQNCKSYYSFMEQCARHERKPNIITVPDVMSIYENCFHDNVIGFSLERLSKLMQFDELLTIPLSDQHAYWDVCLIWNEENKNTNHIKGLSNFLIENTNQ
jgi:DNA-binding transcriptional LysR family regulator